MQLAQEDMILIKGKRSKRPRPASPLALTIATSSSTTADLSGSCNSTDVTHSTTDIDQEEEEDMANCLILLAKGQAGQRRLQPPPPAAEAYLCKTCDKSFASFQALGGHRASHKKPSKPVTLDERKPMREKQGDFVPNYRDDNNSSTILSLQISNRSVLGNVKSRVHECSICRAEFGSGQALGGHMRRHRPIPAVGTAGHGESQGGKRPRNLLSLDLNLPAPEDDHSESKFPFAAKEQVIVFSASPLIDCHY